MPPNAIITCRLCAERFDKGAPPDPTQSDTTFVCEPCATKHGGYPQNGYINPLALKFDTLITPDSMKPKSGLLQRLFKRAKK